MSGSSSPSPKLPGPRERLDYAISHLVQARLHICAVCEEHPRTEKLLLPVWNQLLEILSPVREARTLFDEECRKEDDAA